jgi:hypothetical protein
MAESDPSPYHPDAHPHGYTGEELETPVEFTTYTFKGFDPPGYEGKENPTGVSLKGFKFLPFPELQQFRGEGEVKEAYLRFTHDTHEYRITKMLHECEDHLVMDSVVFHYLFIQRHTMVDNVAKNTFWSTEDLIHWDLTKDYDNDTADGNNNSGNLVYSYGIEIGDNEVTNKGETVSIFNAPDSVWLNFIKELSDV